MDIVSVNGNNSWKFQDYTMTGTLSKSVADGQTNRQTDGQTEIRVLRATWSQLKCRSVILYSWEDIITQDIDQISRSLPNTFQLFACWINQKCLSISITTLTHWGRDKMGGGGGGGGGGWLTRFNASLWLEIAITHGFLSDLLFLFDFRKVYCLRYIWP